MSDVAEPVPAVRTALRRDTVTSLIRQAILDLELKPGQRLVERELIDRTGASRATVREAIRELSAEGLVDLIPMRGAVVANPSLEEIKRIYEVRAMFEGYATRLFTEKASDEQVRELEESVLAMEEIVTRGSASTQRWDFYSVKNRYYELILAGTENPLLNDMLSGLLKRIVAVRVGYFMIGGMNDDAMKEIRDVMDAIRSRDPDAAEIAARRHVEIRGGASVLNLALLFDELDG